MSHPVKRAEIRRHEDRYRVHLYDIGGRFEAKSFAEQLHLTEGHVSAPEGSGGNGGSAPQPLEDATYVLHNPFGKHAEMEFEVTESGLPELSKVLHMHRVKIEEGENLLPDPPAARAATAHHQETQQEAEQHLLTFESEQRHQAAYKGGIGPFLKGLAIWLVPLIVLAGVVTMIIARATDPYQPKDLATAVGIANSPPRPENLIKRILWPDRTQFVEVRVPGVKLLDGNEAILPDGHWVRLEGMGELRTLLMEVQDLRQVPVFRLTAEDGKLLVNQVLAGTEEMRTGGEMVVAGRFRIVDDEPRRVFGSAGQGEYRWLKQAQYDESRSFEALVGRHISVEGRVVEEDGRYVVRTEGFGMALQPLPLGAETGKLLEFLESREVTGIVDGVFEQMYAWRSDDPRRSRRDNRILGEMSVHVVQAQKVIVGRPQIR